MTFFEGDGRNELGKEVCFVEFSGHLIAELRSPEASELYRQYLVRGGDEDRFEVCAMVPVWLALEVLAKNHPVGYSMESLQYTVRNQGESTLMVLISQSRDLRDFLTLALPELAAFCDSAKTDELRWYAFVRSEQQDGEGDESPAE